MENLKNVGTINLNRSKGIYVSDPCYSIDTMGLTSLVEKFVQGTYNCFVEQLDVTDFGSRVKKMVICHTDFDVATLPNESEEFQRVSVDSGTMSIGSYAYYDKFHDSADDETNDKWYEKNVCALDRYKVADKRLFICSSGFGDGIYYIDLYRDNNKKVYAVGITFIGEDSE